ncbi:hypothetical protein FBEOM_6193 [Fusarium beomiforme]|uniref:Uncharacterized protein n=1 Tax=Fusarium beomiforme TaxID=44412 RepID=A0A9P5DYA0_9HYPO|nr:hypothetical protein FBEOM_6193 [Fusarium beomiforme]
MAPRIPTSLKALRASTSGLSRAISSNTQLKSTPIKTSLPIPGRLPDTEAAKLQRAHEAVSRMLKLVDNLEDDINHGGSRKDLGQELHQMIQDLDHLNQEIEECNNGENVRMPSLAGNILAMQMKTCHCLPD